VWFSVLRKNENSQPPADGNTKKKSYSRSLTRRSAFVNSLIDSIYLKFFHFHPQVCFVVNRRDRHHSISYRAISRLTDACEHFIAGLAQAVQMRGPRDLLGNLDGVATKKTRLVPLYSEANVKSRH
jgi:hypothetical protein